MTLPVIRSAGRVVHTIQAAVLTNPERLTLLFLQALPWG